MANKYWIATEESFYDSSTNWSLMSGGIPNTTVPNVHDTIIYDHSGQGDCLLNTEVSVLGIKVLPDYTGTLKQSNYSLSVGIGDALFEGGSFQGNSQITIYGNFLLSETDFNSTPETLTLYD